MDPLNGQGSSVHLLAVAGTSQGVVQSHHLRLQESHIVAVAHRHPVVNRDLLLIVDLALQSLDLHLPSLIPGDHGPEVDPILEANQDLKADNLQAAGVEAAVGVQVVIAVVEAQGEMVLRTGSLARPLFQGATAPQVS